MVRRWQVYLAIIFFLIIVFIGIIAEVSFSVTLTRALSWSFVVLALVVLNTQVVLRVIEQNLEEPDSGIDITIPLENPEEPVRPAGRTGNLAGSQQIEKDLEEMVKNDPVRVADLTRKMGLD
ncbi:MAG TPA: hypothetical protein VHS59_13005 [Bacillota bacterium]|nr:hypothetical protein [Bacillota bacterium]